MAVENLYGSIALDGYFDPTTPPGVRGKASATGGRVHSVTETVEVSAAASATSTYTLARIPSNARILDQSVLHFDDLASSGSPTLDIGLFAVNANITDDDDALNDGIDCATAAGTADVLKTPISMIGLEAWDLVNGQTSDPGGMLDVKVTIKDADCNTGGTLTLELYYSIP